MNSQNILMQDIQTLIAQSLEVDPTEVTPELAFGDLPQWDSLGHMEVMLQLEEKFGVPVDADLIAALTSVPAIYAYLQEHAHDRA